MPMSPRPSAFTSMKVVLFAAALTAGLGCGPPAAPTTPTGTALPAQVSSMTPEQRTILAVKLRSWGSGWALENLEKQLTLSVTETPAEYLLTFTARGASGLHTVKHLLKQEIGLSGEELAIPDGDELTAAQRAQADEIIAATRTLWLHQPGGRTEPVDVSTGIAALAGKRAVTTRARGGFAVFYMKGAPPLEQATFAVAVDLAGHRVTEARLHEVPPNETDLISPEDIALVDTAMKKHGDFGVYGKVTEGLVALSKTSGIVIRPNPTTISVAIGASGGHDLSFSVNRRTGTLDGVAAGHSVSPGD